MSPFQSCPRIISKEAEQSGSSQVPEPVPILNTQKDTDASLDEAKIVWDMDLSRSFISCRISWEKNRSTPGIGYAIREKSNWTSLLGSS